VADSDPVVSVDADGTVLEVVTWPRSGLAAAMH
jgi:hypothetical protein